MADTNPRPIERLITVGRRLEPIMQSAGPGVVQAGLTGFLTHLGFGWLAPEAGVVGGAIVHQLIQPAAMDPNQPDQPLTLPAPLAFAAPVDDPRCTPGYCVWFPVVDSDIVPRIHPDKVAAVVPVWLSTEDAVTRYAQSVLRCPVSLAADPAAAAVAVQQWQDLPVADRSTPVFLPETPWLVTRVTPDGPWLPWRLYSVGGVSRAAVIPERTAGYAQDVWRPFTAEARMAASLDEALQLLRSTGTAHPDDPVVRYPASALTPYFLPAPPGTRRPQVMAPALSARSWPWPDAAPDPPRRADGTYVWHVVNMKEHGTVGWTVDALRRIRLAGSDAEHPWHFPSTRAALDAFRAHGLFAAYGQPPIAPRELLRAYPEILRSPGALLPPVDRGLAPPLGELR